ncbi:hypothetical protein ACFL0U_03315 [Pseudomonadota bacterium]
MSASSIKCKYCKSTNIVKNGFVLGRQRYKCKNCGKNFTINPNSKYSEYERDLAIFMYINNCGIRKIGKILNIPFQLVSYWIKRKRGILKEEIKRRNENQEARKMEILEIDELFTYVKKRQAEYEYGLLLIGTEIKLVHLK